jgi:bifunctional DNA-binding transcriptional regulator/antitoxin component of YhaV-PrlF toxin-antitoxin module
MATATEVRPCVMEKPIPTMIVGKFQVTVPPDVRKLYQLREGDILEWHFDQANGRLTIVPKRAELITPQIENEMREIKQQRARDKQKVSSAK